MNDVEEDGDDSDDEDDEDSDKVSIWLSFLQVLGNPRFMGKYCQSLEENVDLKY
jgi:hypothetical protein